MKQLKNSITHELQLHLTYPDGKQEMGIVSRGTYVKMASLKVLLYSKGLPSLQKMQKLTTPKGTKYVLKIERILQHESIDN